MAARAPPAAPSTSPILASPPAAAEHRRRVDNRDRRPCSGVGDRVARRPYVDRHGAHAMTAETLTPDRALPTAELLTQLLRVLESAPRRAPEDVVELVRRELGRQAGRGR